MDVLVLGILNGISFGTILFLLGSGLSLILGVMGILNLTHGALYMIATYVGWSLAIKYKLNFLLAILAGGVSAGVVGLLIERGFLRFLYKQLNEQVLVTFGFVLILTNLSLWLWGPTPQAPFTAPFLSLGIPVMGWSYPVARLAIIFVGLALAAVLWWLQEKTRIRSHHSSGDGRQTDGNGVRDKRREGFGDYLLWLFYGRVCGCHGGSALRAEP